MSEAIKIRSIKSLVKAVNFEGKSLLSINDLTNDQIHALFELGVALEPWNRSIIELARGSVMATLFFQPSTRTRLSFETAMNRLGGAVLTETTPLISSSAAKEESLSDMLKVVAKYANVIVMRHPNDVEARQAAPYSEAPIINGGFGHWEHPTQALLDLYTLWRTFGKVEGVKVCVATPDMVEARTGHSMAFGLARLGAKVTLASTSARRAPDYVMNKIRELGVSVVEELDLNSKTFSSLISGMDMVYLPGCSAPKGEAAEAFKKLMDDYFVNLDILDKVRREQDRVIYVTHTLPRRAGEMDLRIDDTVHQKYFDAIAYSVSIRMALVTSILGV